MLRRVVGLAAATLVVAAASVVAPRTAAEAATCSSASGVSVVVDFHQLGGTTRTFCAADGAGKTAADLFAEANDTLTRVTSQPGFVCQVNGAPTSSCQVTPPATAYWSLWWSDGRSGDWVYASLGVDSLTIRSGGYVALSWQKGSAQAPPGITPTAHGSHPTSSPTSKPPASSHPSSAPGVPVSSTAPTGPATPGTSSTPPSTGPSNGPSKGKAHDGKGGHDHHHSKGPKPQDSGSNPSDGSQAVGASTQVSGGSGGSGPGGLPGWVAPVAVAALFVGVATFVITRRKSSGGA